MGAVRIIQTVLALVFLAAASCTARAELQQEAAGADMKWIINSGSVSNLPAGSLTALALALERGAAAVWLDLVLSSDGQVVLLPGAAIEEITNVTEIYPDRSRPDGRTYAFDFSLEELKRLSHRPAPEAMAQSYSQSTLVPDFPIISLAEALGFIDRVFQEMDQPVTLVCTLKQGWLHQEQQMDLGTTVLQLLDAHRSAFGSIDFFLASYDPEELQQLALGRESAPPGEIAFIQLVGNSDGVEVQRLEFGSHQPYSYDLLFSRVGIKLVSTYAAVIGLDASTILDGAGTILHPRLLEDVKTLGMKSICNRIDRADYSHDAINRSGNELFEHLLFTVGFDGIVTAEDSRARKWLDERANGSTTEQQRTIERLIDQIEDSGIEPSDFLQSGATR
jgi:glycerophosphoryl diester phosphodiesterase